MLLIVAWVPEGHPECRGSKLIKTSDLFRSILRQVDTLCAIKPTHFPYDGPPSITHSVTRSFIRSLIRKAILMSSTAD